MLIPICGALFLISVAQCQNFNSNLRRNPNLFVSPQIKKFARPPHGDYEMVSVGSEIDPRSIHTSRVAFIPGATTFTGPPRGSLGDIPLSPRPEYNNFDFSHGEEEEDKTPVSNVALNGDELLNLFSVALPPGLANENLEETHLTSPDAPYDTDASEPLTKSPDNSETEKEAKDSLSDNEINNEGYEVKKDQRHEVSAEPEPRQSIDTQYLDSLPNEEIVYEDYYEDEEIQSHKREIPGLNRDAEDFVSFENLDYANGNDYSDYRTEESLEFRHPDNHPSNQQEQSDNTKQRFRPQTFEGVNRSPQNQQHSNTPENREINKNSAFEYQNRPNLNRSPYTHQRNNANSEVAPPQFERRQPVSSEFQFQEPQREESQSPKFQTKFLNERQNSLQEFEAAETIQSRVVGRPKYQTIETTKRKTPFRQFEESGSENGEGENFHGNLRYTYLEEEEEEQKPDRLSLLLQQTKFNCQKKKDGYYADEELGCEVFHFCQDKVKHSWLCPNGASFHQVHLICMPQPEDNICAKSSKFHFVNDYLYKETEESTGRKRKYVQRYYPKNYEGGIASLEPIEEVPRYDEQEEQRFRQPPRGQLVAHSQKSPQSEPVREEYHPTSEYDEYESEPYPVEEHVQYRDQTQNMRAEPAHQPFVPYNNQRQQPVQRHHQERSPRPGASFLANENHRPREGPQYHNQRRRYN